VHALVPLMLGAMAQDHERATGPWQAEALALPQSFVLTAGALAQAKSIVEGMTVDAARMRRNLDLTGGLISAEAVMVALAERIGRPAAHHTVEQACNTALASGRSLAAVLAEIPEVAAHFDAAALDRLTDPARQVGAASALIDQVLRRVDGMAG
jgi:3-carboxy-cis,cis-muconate cycloisomerase